MDAWSCPWCKKCDLCGGTGNIAERVSFEESEVGEDTLDETCPAESGMPTDELLNSIPPLPTPRYFDPIAVTLSSRCPEDIPSYPPGVFAGKPKSLVTLNMAISVFSFVVIALLVWFW